MRNAMENNLSIIILYLFKFLYQLYYSGSSTAMSLIGSGRKDIFVNLSIYTFLLTFFLKTNNNVALFL